MLTYVNLTLTNIPLIHSLIHLLQTGASTLSINPIVKHQDRPLWENFSVALSQAWLTEAHRADREVNPGLYTDERYELGGWSVNRTTERIETPSFNGTGGRPGGRPGGGRPGRNSTNSTSGGHGRGNGRGKWGQGGNATSGFDRSDDLWNVTGITPFIWEMNYSGFRAAMRASGNGTRPDRSKFQMPAKRSDMYLPRWQRAPAPDYRPGTNENFASKNIFKNVIKGMLENDRPVLSEVVEATFLNKNYNKRFDPLTQMEPHSFLLQPIYDTLKTDRKPAAVLSAFFRWGLFFENVLPQTQDGIIVVLNGTCGQTFTYELKGKKAYYLGQGDGFFNSTDKEMCVTFEVAPFAKLEEDNSEGGNKYCQYNIQIFPSEEFKDEFFSNDPYYVRTDHYALSTPLDPSSAYSHIPFLFLFQFSAIVIACFMLTTLVFVIYDVMVTLRNRRVMATYVLHLQTIIVWLALHSSLTYFNPSFSLLIL